METYRHYGSNEFSYSMLKHAIAEIENYNGKPRGLWASPINSGLTWYDWCMAEDFYTDKLDIWFDFTIKEDSKILHVYKEDDIIPYIIKHRYTERLLNTLCYNRPNTDCADRFDMEKLHSKFDGIELHLDQNYMDLRYTIFYTWDVDSIVIWNPDIIVPIQNNETSIT